MSIVENDLTNEAEGEESDDEETDDEETNGEETDVEKADGERNLESPKDSISSAVSDKIKG